MRNLRLLAFVSLAAISSAAACAAPSGEDVSESESELVQFNASNFAGAPALGYGDTSAALETSRTKWGVIRWNGAAGDEIAVTITATTPDRTPRAYLVEKRADGKYVAILSGTQSTDGVVRAKLAKTQEYFIVFRDSSRRNASFTAKLDRAGGLPVGCAGPALLEAGIVERTPQAQVPAISTTGIYETSIRRCNVATGCANPVTQRNEATQVTMQKRSDGKWIVSVPFSAEHDGATGDLKGTASLRADDGRTISVAVAGAATTSCISASGRNRTEIDSITYYDIEVSFKATTPAIAARTPYPATPPATECDGQEIIPDEEVLARFPRGSASVLLGQANIQEDSQYCHPQTGCRPWARAAATIGGSVRALRATAIVLGSDSVGLQFWNGYYGDVSQKPAFEDGSFAVTSESLLGRGVATAHVGSISETHLQVKEANVTVAGDTKYRRYACIPIPSHP